MWAVSRGPLDVLRMGPSALVNLVHSSVFVSVTKIADANSAGADWCIYTDSHTASKTYNDTVLRTRYSHGQRMLGRVDTGWSGLGGLGHSTWLAAVLLHTSYRTVTT